MATAQARETLSSRLKVLMFDEDPGKTTIDYTSWQAMEDYEHVMITTMVSVGGAMKALSGIYVATDASASGVALLKAFSDPTTADAVGDTRFAEISAEQVAQLGAENGAVYTHFSVGLLADVATDEFVVTYIMEPGRFKHTGLTADVTA